MEGNFSDKTRFKKRTSPSRFAKLGIRYCAEKIIESNLGVPLTGGYFPKTTGWVSKFPKEILKETAIFIFIRKTFQVHSGMVTLLTLKNFCVH